MEDPNKSKQPTFNSIFLLFNPTVLTIYSDYFPQNIMYDKRVARGSTYAAMVIPAGQTPDQNKEEAKFKTKRPQVYIFNLFDFRDLQVKINNQIFILIEKYQLQTQSQEGYTWKYKLKGILNNWLTNLMRESKVSAQNSI